MDEEEEGEEEEEDEEEEEVDEEDSHERGRKVWHDGAASKKPPPPSRSLIRPIPFNNPIQESSPLPTEVKGNSTPAPDPNTTEGIDSHSVSEESQETDPITLSQGAFQNVNSSFGRETESLQPNFIPNEYDLQSTSPDRELENPDASLLDSTAAFHDLASNVSWEDVTKNSENTMFEGIWDTNSSYWYEDGMAEDNDTDSLHSLKNEADEDSSQLQPPAIFGWSSAFQSLNKEGSRGWSENLNAIKKSCGGQCLSYELITSLDVYEVRKYPSTAWASTVVVTESRLLAQLQAYHQLQEYLNGTNDPGLQLNVSFPFLTQIQASRHPGVLQELIDYTISIPLLGLNTEPPRPLSHAIQIDRLESHTVFVQSWRSLLWQMTEDVVRKKSEDFMNLLRLHGHSFFDRYTYLALYALPWTAEESIYELWIYGSTPSHFPPRGNRRGRTSVSVVTDPPPSVITTQMKKQLCRGINSNLEVIEATRPVGLVRVANTGDPECPRNITVAFYLPQRIQANPPQRGPAAPMVHISYLEDLIVYVWPVGGYLLEPKRVHAELQRFRTRLTQSWQRTLCLGISCLQLFIQANYTGPQLDPSCLPLEIRDHAKLEASVSFLACEDGIHHMTKYPELMWIAKVILIDGSFTSHLPTHGIWSLRCIQVMQQLLEEPSPTLHSKAEKVVGELLSSDFLKENPLLHSIFDLEVAWHYLSYGFVGKAQTHLQSCLKSIGLSVNLTGKMGRRTKFQKIPMAQLTIDVGKAKGENAAEGLHLHSAHLPKDVALDDDVRLDKVKFEDFVSQGSQQITTMDQAAILTLCALKQQSSAKDDLSVEELTTYLSCVLEQPYCWSIHFSALWMRSLLEGSADRTRERAMLQLQELADAVNREEPPPQDRLRYFFQCRIPTVWNLQRKLGQSLMNVGAVKSALDIFLPLKLWEDILACYYLQQRRDKAEEIARDLVEKDPSPKHWCILGDATNDIQCYEEAWKVSEGHYARAKRSIGLLFFKKNKYEECIKPFQDSLQVNSLQVEVWMRLAFAALETSKWEVAASAYRMCVTIEYDNFQAWNNLSKAYMNLGQAERAWKTLQEAIRCCYDDWHIWDNFMWVSLQSGHLSEVFEAQNRLLDLKDRHVNVAILAKAVDHLLDMRSNNDIHSPLEKAIKLLGRITSQVTAEPMLWLIYSRLLSMKVDKTEETQQRSMQYLSKALHSQLQRPNVLSDIPSTLQTISFAEELGQGVESVASQWSNKTQSLSQLSSAKLSIQGLISRVKQQHTKAETGELPQELQIPISDLEKLSSSIIDAISGLKKLESYDLVFHFSLSVRR
ncbi:unnamed protein product [Darwinula stevensoni]|uniref:Tetratricopeptide repeat protein 27 n=1 Tax=Darwinula stevensoni TaxID=69355 RepID=A0A7R9ACT4_9CRUS|nr:unnamed protein product [Darwinula stevensoni]CAG0900130.1 unnamed protein product [Darwinula stevensoni]